MNLNDLDIKCYKEKYNLFDKIVTYSGLGFLIAGIFLCIILFVTLIAYGMSGDAQTEYYVKEKEYSYEKAVEAVEENRDIVEVCSTKLLPIASIITISFGAIWISLKPIRDSHQMYKDRLSRTLYDEDLVVFLTRYKDILKIISLNPNEWDLWDYCIHRRWVKYSKSEDGNSIAQYGKEFYLYPNGLISILRYRFLKYRIDHKAETLKFMSQNNDYTKAFSEMLKEDVNNIKNKVE